MLRQLTRHMFAVSSHRRKIAVGLSVCLLSVPTACSNFPVLNRVQNALDFALFGQPDAPVTRTDIDKLPYASIRARLGRSGKVVMVLGRYDGNDLHWISADSAVITTRHGRIVKTVGLKSDLRNTRFPNVDPIASGAHKLNQPVTHIRVIDFKLGNRFGISVESTMTPAGRERIQILEKHYDTLVIKEKNKIDQLDWSHVNTFWVDAHTGFIWRSIQHYSPDLPPIEIDVLKPAG